MLNMEGFNEIVSCPWELLFSIGSGFLTISSTRFLYCPTEASQVCQLSCEVRLGRNPQKIATWVRTWLPGSRWLGKAYAYRLDREGYAWLNLDWIDSSRVQRPGAPLKPFQALTIYYPHELRWETEGELTDSHGQPKPRYAPVEVLKMGIR